MARIDGKSVLITGAAQGIGLGIARRLAAEGGNVMIGDLNEDGAARAAAAIREEGHEASACRVDVADRASVQALIATTVSEFGSLDVVFNNAGFNEPEQFLDIKEETWHAIMNVNGLGVLIGTQEAAKQMISQGTGGKIINTASIAGRQGYPSFVPYCASKFAVVAIIQGAARALAGDKITVNGFAPGVVDTPLWEKLDEDLMNIGDSSEPGEAMRVFSESILLGRPALPEDIAGTALYLASADSDYMTGQIMMIDGGMVLV